MPTVKWKRDDNAKININKSLVGKENIKTNEKFNGGFSSDRKLVFIVTEWDGDTLEISRISRLDMGAYLCIAANSVPPTVSKRIKVSVDCKYTFRFVFFCKLVNVWFFVEVMVIHLDLYAWQMYFVRN